MDHDEWAAALADLFFQPDFGRKHVLFFVDRTTLADVSGVGEDDATRAFVAAIKARLAPRSPSKLFQPIVKATMRWKVHGASETPPCLPTLGLAVLAATEMRKTLDVAAHNYYEWLVKLLEEGSVSVQPKHARAAYGDAMPLLWETLKWWLDEKHRGKLGFSTIEPHKKWTKIGYADSQTIFTSSDREKLAQFFRWISLSPGEEISEAELIEYFRAWAAGREDINPGARIMLEDDDYPAQLAAILARAAGRWEGFSRTEEGRREALLRVTLTGPPRPSLGIAAPCPPGFPSELTFTYGQKQLHLAVLEERAEPNEVLWYTDSEITVTPAILQGGLSISVDRFAFRLPVAAVHILHMDPELGCWASSDTLLPGTKAWLLVQRSRLADVKSVLEKHASEGWTVIERSEVAPPGWALFRDVIVNSMGQTLMDVPEGLEMLVPRETNRFRFSGGLPLPRGTDVYLSDGDPDVTLPPLYEEGRRLRLDGDPLDVDAETDRVRLADLQLQGGEHVVELGPLQRSYTTLRTLGNRQPAATSPIGHSFAKGAGGPEPLALDAIELVSPAWLTVQGAVITSDEDFETPRSPVILPRAARDRVILGARPGEVEHVATPEKPPWMSRVDLHSRVFEHHPEFPVAWVLLHWDGGKPSDVHKISDLPISDPLEDPGAVGRWAAAVLSLTDARFRSGESDWPTVTAAAREVQP